MFIRLTIISFVLALSIASCGKTIHGNGNIITQEHEVGDFDRVEIAGVFEVELIKGNDPIEVHTDENLHEHINISVEDGALRIDSKDKYLESDQLLVRVFYKDLEEIEISGAAELTSKEAIKGDRFELDVSGACDGNLEVKVDELEIDLSGGSEIELSGKAEHLELDISGAGEIHAYDLKLDRADIAITGAGEVEINVKDAMSVKVTGAGEVTYMGDPKISQHITGAGEIKRAEGV